MKRFTLLLVFSAWTTALLAQQQSQSTDTLVVESPKRVTVMTTDTSQVVQIEGSLNNPNYRYSNTLHTYGNSSAKVKTSKGLDFSFPLIKSRRDKKHQMVLRMTLNLGLGMIATLNAPEGMRPNVGVSRELMLKDLFLFEYRTKGVGHSWGIGYGLSWQNFRMTERTRFDRASDGSIFLSSYANDVSPQFSRLKVYSSNLSFNYGYRFSKQFKLSASAHLNFNHYGSLLTRYKHNGHKQKELQKDLHLSPVTADLMLRAHFRWFSLYAKYNPFSPISSSFGPQFNSFSFGVFLF